MCVSAAAFAILPVAERIIRATEAAPTIEQLSVTLADRSTSAGIGTGVLQFARLGKSTSRRGR